MGNSNIKWDKHGKNIGNGQWEGLGTFIDTGDKFDGNLKKKIFIHLFLC